MLDKFRTSSANLCSQVQPPRQNRKGKSLALHLQKRSHAVEASRNTKGLWFRARKHLHKQHSLITLSPPVAWREPLQNISPHLTLERIKRYKASIMHCDAALGWRQNGHFYKTARALQVPSMNHDLTLLSVACLTPQPQSISAAFVTIRETSIHKPARVTFTRVSAHSPAFSGVDESTESRTTSTFTLTIRTAAKTRCSAYVCSPFA